MKKFTHVDDLKSYTQEHFLRRKVFLIKQVLHFRCVSCLREYRVSSAGDECDLGKRFWACPYGCPLVTTVVSPSIVLARMKYGLTECSSHRRPLDGDGRDRVRPTVEHHRVERRPFAPEDDSDGRALWDFRDDVPEDLVDVEDDEDISKISDRCRVDSDDEAE